MNCNKPESNNARSIHDEKNKRQKMVATQHLWYMTARIDTISPQNIKKESKVNLLHPYILRRIRTLTQISNSVKPPTPTFLKPAPFQREADLQPRSSYDY